MRIDARENRTHLLSIARDVIRERGVEASLRDIARRADVGLATLYRHFPTREALLEALLRATLDDLTHKASELAMASAPDDALVLWLRDAVTFMQSYSGIVAVMATALADEGSALHASCANLRSAGARLLSRAQAQGLARPDLDGIDLFALIGALGWLGDQASFAPRIEHFIEVITRAILTSRGSSARND
jgi:AcrR family transcriptional regulator